MNWQVGLGAGLLFLALEFLANELAEEHTKHLILLESFIMLSAALGI